MLPLTLLLPIAVLQDAPLAPINVWTVSATGTECILFRPFGNIKRPTTFALRTIPLSNNIQAVLIFPSAPTQFEIRQVEIGFGPSGATTKIWYRSSMSSVANRMAEFTASDEFMTGIASVSNVTFRFPRQKPVRLQLSASAADLRALDYCEAELMRRWGVDPSAEARAVQPAIAKSERKTWFRDVLTPKQMWNEKSGMSIILWTIGTDGNTRDCRAVVSAGKVLDDAACDKVHALGKYEPARDKDGSPVAVHETARITWALHKF